mmetsp:Transcript_47130/g.47979  ORF Transcript_47130/g.47979 Transcript_47130/m.47979 type:complete len:390 (-) Transcript_47130:515-1684(-)
MGRNTTNIVIIAVLVISVYNVDVINGFSTRYNNNINNNVQKILSLPSSRSSSSSLFMSSFSADGSEYSAKDSDYESDGDGEEKNWGEGDSYREDQQDNNAPTKELKPVPMSKNTGNRFVSLYWDHELEGGKLNKEEEPRESWWLHYDRDDLNEDHVMFCRKNNLYNETFNSDSMVDILRSLPILASDLKRVVGHCMIMESTDIKHVKELIREDPILKSLTDDGERIDEVPLYRWRHIRDYTLRIDDGRFGFPCMMVGLDDDPETIGNEGRFETEKAVLEYLIKSQKVIMAGPLYLPTEFKNDPSSFAVGDLVMFNAKDREDAINFVENMPSTQNGLYKDLRVHFYNQLDVTGKFVSEDPNRDAPGYQMKEAMEHWGYPVDDEQTPWLNW